MPVPPPTLPSGTAPPRAVSMAWNTSSGCTWKPLTSFSQPSQVSATTGRDHQYSDSLGWPCLTRHAITASRTTPTLWVLVIITGPSRKPDSSTQVVPVISPLPFSVNQAAKTGSLLSRPRGRTAVTPVRTGPTPTLSGPSPEIRVVLPTCTPATSVMALSGPGVPSKGTPKSRARGGFWAKARVAANRTIITGAQRVFRGTVPPG